MAGGCVFASSSLPGCHGCGKNARSAILALCWRRWRWWPIVEPVTRGDIEQVRGVTVSSSIMRTLVERGWVRVVGHRDVPGRPAVFATTRQFLDDFGLKTLEELPPVHELKGFEGLEQLEAELYDVPPSQTLPLPEYRDGEGDGDHRQWGCRIPPLLAPMRQPLMRQPLMRRQPMTARLA